MYNYKYKFSISTTITILLNLLSLPVYCKCNYIVINMLEVEQLQVNKFLVVLAFVVLY